MSRETRSSKDLSHLSFQQLQVPPRGRGRGSRSPSPAAHVGRAFFETPNSHPHQPETPDVFQGAPSTMDEIQEPGTVATLEEIRRYAAHMRQHASQLTTALATTSRLLETTSAAAEAATAAANASGASNLRKRKPELPAWDPRNIESWVRRVKAAYQRGTITEPADKFAFLESIIPVDAHPRINKFFNDAATETNWIAFLAFLRERYGRTKEEQVEAAINGIPRDGRRPTDLMAEMDDQMGKITLDDIKKAHLMRQMPSFVRTSMCDRIKTLNSTQAAEAADAYFDRDGRPLVQPSVAEINEVQETYTSPYDDAAEVNAINGKKNNVRFRGRSQQRTFTPAFTPNLHEQSSGNQRGASGNNSAPSAPTVTKKPGLCRNHAKFGEETKVCHAPCNYRAGNSNGGRR